MNSRVLFVALATFALLLPSSQGAVRVLKQEGLVSIAAKPDGPWVPLVGVKELAAPTTIKTGKDSYIDLELAGGSLLRVTMDSVVRIEKSETHDEVVDIQLDVRKGRGIGISRAKSPDSKFEVKTPVAVAGARTDGTAFDATERGVFRCETGELVVVYIIDGVVLPPWRLNGNQMISPPTDPTNPVHVVQINPEAFGILSREIEDLKLSQKAGAEKK